MHLLSTSGHRPLPRLAEHGADGFGRPGQACAGLARRLALAGLLAALLSPLAACGRKAALEAPPGVPKDAFPKHYPPKDS
jgi:predicted small lipoprotein YifL